MVTRVQRSAQRKTRLQYHKEEVARFCDKKCYNSKERKLIMQAAENFQSYESNDVLCVTPIQHLLQAPLVTLRTSGNTPVRGILIDKGLIPATTRESCWAVKVVWGMFPFFSGRYGTCLVNKCHTAASKDAGGLVCFLSFLLTFLLN